MPVIAFVGSHVSGLPAQTSTGYDCLAVPESEFHSLSVQGLPLGHRSHSPRTPVRSDCDFLLATRSLSAEVELPRSTNLGAGYQPVSAEIPTLANVFAFRVSRVRGVTLMANDSRCRRQAVLLYASRSVMRFPGYETRSSPYRLNHPLVPVRSSLWRDREHLRQSTLCTLTGKPLRAFHR